MVALTYDEAKGLWDDAKCYRAYWLRVNATDVYAAYKFLNFAWDPYRSSERVKAGFPYDGVVAELNTNFDFIENGHPWGEFKQLGCVTPEDYYNKWLERSRVFGFNKKSGKELTLVDACWVAVRDYQKVVFGEVRFGKVLFVKAYCLYLAKLARGMALEAEAISQFNNLLVDCGFTVVEGSVKDEGCDIDAFVLDGSDSPVLNVSIKTFNGLSPASMSKWYSKKKDFTKHADIFMGFHEEGGNLCFYDWKTSTSLSVDYIVDLLNIRAAEVACC